VAIHLNQSGRLHCETGAAVEFRDGFGVYALHGVVVPREWIEQRDTIDPRLALTHPNVEQRRLLRELLGWKRVLDAVGSTVIDRDADPEIGTLLECELGDDDGTKARFLLMRCGTGREFVERVSPECTTAIEAQNWRWQLKPGTYTLEIRT